MSTVNLILFLPLLGAITIGLCPTRLEKWIRPLALVIATLTLLAACAISFLYDPTSANIQFFTRSIGYLHLGKHFALGVDGFSLPMILLSTLLCLIALLASADIRDRQKSYYLFMFLLETGMLGVFMAQDWILFYIFWELTLIPLFFLIDRWGGKNRHHAALNFVLYTMGGSVFLLISLLLAFDFTPAQTFSMSEMARILSNLPVRNQVIIFLGMLVGFGVKMPIFPMHGWLPLAHVEAPSPVSILLSGALLKMGAYGLIRAATMLPDAVVALQGLLATLAFISLLYGGLLAWRQTDLKRMIAYSSISHMGVVLIGIASLTVAGLNGAVIQMVAHGLAAATLFLLIGLLYQRTHTREVSDYSSLASMTPRFAIFISLAFISSVGMPGTAGFVAELHAIIGAFQSWQKMAVLLSIGMLISAAYSLRTVGCLLTGPSRPHLQNITDLHGLELVAASVLSSAILLLGIVPSPILNWIAASVKQLATTLANHS